MESLNDNPLTDKVSQESVKGPSDMVNDLESRLKVLMQTTGATSPNDLLQRFTTQKEAMQRLNYLRTVTETEKRHLEHERDELTSRLEQLKFSDTKENEVYCLLLSLDTFRCINTILLILFQKPRVPRGAEKEHFRKKFERK